MLHCETKTGQQYSNIATSTLKTNLACKDFQELAQIPLDISAPPPLVLLGGRVFI
jgi:hypothetical protein